MINTAEQKNQIGRINRKIEKRDEFHVLRTSRGWRELQNLGDHYLLDRYTNAVIDHHINLDELEAELKARISSHLCADCKPK